MSKKYWQENLILIFIIIIMVAGFWVAKNYLVEVFSSRVEEMGLSQSKKMKEEIKKLTKPGFDFLLFNQEQYQNLKEFIDWPPEQVDNQGNDEPFKELLYPTECLTGTCPVE